MMYNHKFERAAQSRRTTAWTITILVYLAVFLVVGGRFLPKLVQGVFKEKQEEPAMKLVKNSKVKPA